MIPSLQEITFKKLYDGKYSSDDLPFWWLSPIPSKKKAFFLGKIAKQIQMIKIAERLICIVLSELPEEDREKFLVGLIKKDLCIT